MRIIKNWEVLKIGSYQSDGKTQQNLQEFRWRSLLPPLETKSSIFKFYFLKKINKSFQLGTTFMHCKTKFVTNKKILVALSKSKDGRKIVWNYYSKRFGSFKKTTYIWEERPQYLTCNILQHKLDNSNLIILHYPIYFCKIKWFDLIMISKTHTIEIQITKKIGTSL